VGIAVSDSFGTPPQLSGAVELVSTALGLLVNAAETRRGVLRIGEPGGGSLGRSIADISMSRVPRGTSSVAQPEQQLHAAFSVTF